MSRASLEKVWTVLSRFHQDREPGSQHLHMSLHFLRDHSHQQSSGKSPAQGSCSERLCPGNPEREGYLQQLRDPPAAVLLTSYSTEAPCPSAFSSFFVGQKCHLEVYWASAMPTPTEHVQGPRPCGDRMRLLLHPRGPTFHWKQDTPTSGAACEGLGMKSLT